MDKIVQIFPLIAQKYVLFYTSLATKNSNSNIDGTVTFLLLDLKC